MAKRSNPFINDIIPQSKIHIGLKQFNNNEDRLKKVYEKTLELLFKGAKKIPSQDATTTEIVPDTKKDRMKQLLIGKDCTLLNSNNMVFSKQLPVQPCLCGSLMTEALCAYCEKVLCATCRHLCEHCDQCYCSNCSIIGSESSQICVSCYV